MPNNVYDDEDTGATIRQALIFTWIFLLFIMSWISVAVVGRALDNFTFSTLKLNDKSTYHTTIIAIVIVVIELVTIYYFYTIGIQVYDPFYTENSTENSTDLTCSSADKITQLGRIIML